MKFGLDNTIRTLVGISVLTGCDSAVPEPTAERTDSAGIEVVSSTGDDLSLSWAFSPEFSLGGSEEGPESFSFASTLTVATDATGHIYVLDTQARRVVQFTSQGEAVREYGRGGEGPGELVSPGSLAIGPDGSVAVFDYGKGGLVRFSSSGEVLPEHPFRFFPWPGQRRHIGIGADGVLVTTMIPAESPDQFRHALQLVSESDTVVIADHEFPRAEMVRYPSCGGGLNLPRIFEVQVNWSPTGDGAMVSRRAGYQLELYRGSDLARLIRRDLPLREATRDLAIAELGEGFTINFGRGPCTIPPHEMVDDRGFADAVPWVSDLAVSADGELWVSRYEVGSDSRGPTDVFDASGEYIGTLAPTDPFPVAFLGNDRLVAVEKDKFEIHRLTIYRIDRTAGAG